MSDGKWIRIEKDGETVAIIKLPLGVSALPALAKVWPGSSVSTSEPLAEAARLAAGHSDDDMRDVTVCSECFQASCWQGKFMCYDSAHASTIDLPVWALRRLSLEHESHWA